MDRCRPHSFVRRNSSVVWTRPTTSSVYDRRLWQPGEEDFWSLTTPRVRSSGTERSTRTPGVVPAAVLPRPQPPHDHDVILTTTKTALDAP